MPKKQNYKLHVLQSANVRSQSKPIAEVIDVEKEIDTLIDYLVQIAIYAAISEQGGNY